MIGENVWNFDSAFAQQSEKGAILDVAFVHAAIADDQTEFMCLGAVLDVVVVIAARFAVKLLPIMQLLVEESSEHFPPIPLVFALNKMNKIDGDFVRQTKIIETWIKMPQAVKP